jgi:Flp pilus assembly protein TadD
LEEARRHYEEALRLDGDDAALVMELGGLLVRLGAAPEAEARLREAIARDPGLARANLLLGMLLHTQGRSTEARPFLEEAVRLEPGDPRVRSELERLHAGGTAPAPYNPVP